MSLREIFCERCQAGPLGTVEEPEDGAWSDAMWENRLSGFRCSAAECQPLPGLPDPVEQQQLFELFNQWLREQQNQ